MGRLRRRGVAFVAVVALAGFGAAGAYANFFSKNAANSGNSFAAGTVTLTNNNSGSAAVSLSSAVPTVNDSSTGCVTVSYSGSLTATVHMYVSSLSDSQSLAQYLNVTVTRGTFSPSAPAYPSCTNFVADSGGQIYSGTLAAFPTSYATGVDSQTWTNGSSHVYKILVQLQDTTAAKGKSGTSAVFTFEARNT